MRVDPMGVGVDIVELRRVSVPNLTKTDLWIKANELVASTFDANTTTIFEYSSASRTVVMKADYKVEVRLMYDFLLHGLPKND